MYIGTDCSVPVCDAAINGAWYDRECEDRPSYIGGRYQSNAGCYKCPNGGFCKDFNTCQCAPGWIGDDCRTHAPPPPPPPPSHWGPNGPPDCETGYRGVNCSFPICDKHWADGSTQPCKFGACKSPGNCTCLAHKSFLPATQPGSGIPDNAITGYWGMSCSIPICAQGFFDAECTDNPKAAQTGQKGCWRCANGGECWAPDQCRNCDDGWGGFDCKKKVSEHSASNVASGSTSHPHGCKTGWTGPLCETPVCDCHEHGTCIEPGRCQCATYESVLHEHVAHAPKGLTGWSGKNCQTPLCVQSCHNGGHCNGPDTCECTAAYYGYDCSVLKGPHWQDDESGSVKHGRPGLHGASHSKQGSNGGLAAIQNGDDTPGWSGTQIMWVSLGGVVMFAAAFFAIVYVVRSQRISKGAAKPKFVQLELAEEGGGAASTRL